MSAEARVVEAPDAGTVKELFGTVKKGKAAVLAFMAERLPGHELSPEIINSNRNLLHQACLDNQLDLVQALLNEFGFPDACSQNASGRTTLHYAGAKGNLEIFQYLVEEHNVPLLPNDVGRTPIHAASQRGNVDVVRYICEHELIEPTVEDAQGLTPYHSACERGHLDVAKYLVQEVGVDPNLLSSHGFRPVHVAARGGQMHVLEWLLFDDEGPRVSITSKDSNGRTPVQFAAENGQRDVVEFILGHLGAGSERDEQVRAAFKLAIQRDHVDLVVALRDDYKASFFTVEYMYFAVMHLEDEANVERLRQVLDRIPPTMVNVPHPYFRLTALQLATNQKISLKKKKKKSKKKKEQKNNAKVAAGDGKKLHALSAPGASPPAVDHDVDVVVPVEDGDQDAELHQLELIQKRLPLAQGLLVSYGATPFTSHLSDRHTIPPTGGLQYSIFSNPSYLPFKLLDREDGDGVNNTSDDPLHRTVAHFLCTAAVTDNDTFRWFNELDVRGVRYDIQDDEGWTCFHEACFAGKVFAVKHMLGLPTGRAGLRQPHDQDPDYDASALVDVETFAGETALELVVQQIKQRVRSQRSNVAGNDEELADDLDLDSSDEEEEADDGGNPILNVLCCECCFTEPPPDEAEEDKPPEQDREESGVPLVGDAGPAAHTVDERVQLEDLREIYQLLKTAGAAKLRTRRLKTHLPRRVFFGLFVLLYAVIFPAVLLWRSVGSKLSETLLKIRSSTAEESSRDWVITAKRVGVMAVGLLLALILPLALLYADASEEALQLAVVGISVFGLGFLGAAAVKAGSEVRFVRLLYPETSLEIKHATRDRRQENLLAIFSLVIETIQMMSFAFIPRVLSFSVDVDGEVAGLARPFRAAVLNIDLGVSGDAAVFGGMYVVLALVCAWAIIYGYLGASIATLNAGHPRERPYLRTKFGFIRANFFSQLPASDLLVPLFVQTLFLPIIGRLLATLDCLKGPDDVFYMASTLDGTGGFDGAVVCWEGTHREAAVLAMFALFMFLPTSTFVGVFFLDGESDGQVAFTGVFQLWFLLFEFALSSFQTLILSWLVSVTDADIDSVSPWLSLSLTLIMCTSLAYVTWRFCPCQHLRVINLARTTGFVLASWTTVCALVAHGMRHADFMTVDDFSYLPYTLLILGWGVVVFAAHYAWQHPEQFPFVRHFELQVDNEEDRRRLTMIQSGSSENVTEKRFSTVEMGSM